jgi:chromosome segregation ATPase
MAITRDDLKELSKLLQQDSELRLELAEQILDEVTISRLMHRNAELREAFRRAVLTEDLLQLPSEFREFREETTSRLTRVEQDVAETKERVTRVEQDVAETKERVTRVEQDVAETKERVTRVEQDVVEVKQEVAGVKQDVAEVKQEVAGVKQDVAEVKQEVAGVKQDVAEVKQEVAGVKQDVAEVKQEVTGVKQELQEVKQRVDRLEQITEATQQTVTRLENWQRGEQGRRDGEDYERLIVLRASRLFGAGDGGSPRENERVRKQVEAWLEAAGLLDGDIEPDYDPLIADLIWWKGNKVAVVEISVKVNGRDVERAKRRAETLREAGLDALPVVVGSEWAHPETEILAKQEGVAWRIANAVSEAIIEFRKAR